MATVTGTQIANSVRFLAQDEDDSAYRYADAEILTWLNEAQVALCTVVPAESTKTVGIPLVAGALQTLPAEAISLNSILRNLGVGGVTPGNAITPTVRNMLDVFVPSWQNAAQTAAIVHYIPDATNPKRFHVYPPSVVNNYVEAVYTVVPTPLGSLASVVSVNDTYVPALVNYVLFRLYSKDAEDASNAALAEAYYKAFASAAGVAA
jgi:hypothetical protein